MKESLFSHLLVLEEYIKCLSSKLEDMAYQIVMPHNFLVTTLWLAVHFLDLIGTGPISERCYLAKRNSAVRNAECVKPWAITNESVENYCLLVIGWLMCKRERVLYN